MCHSQERSDSGRLLPWGPQAAGLPTGLGKSPGYWYRDFPPRQQVTVTVTLLPIALFQLFKGSST